MDNSETTFSMFISRHNERALISALEFVKQNTSLSHRVGIKSHEVDFERIENHPRTNNSSPNSVWYNIKVSRPYLIFLIGEKYNQYQGS